MTVIVCNRKEMSCDSRSSYENGEFYTCDDKIERIGAALIGCAGSIDAIFKFLEWYRTKGERPSFDGEDRVEVVELDKDGIWSYSNSTYRMKVCDPFFAIGSGSMAARAAMLCGKSPKEAIAIAIRCDKNSGGPVRTFSLKVDK